MQRNSTTRGPGGWPTAVKPSERIPCPICDVAAGAPCVTYRMHKGERLYVQGRRVQTHPQRVAAARDAIRRTVIKSAEA